MICYNIDEEVKLYKEYKDKNYKNEYENYKYIIKFG